MTPPPLPQQLTMYTVTEVTGPWQAWLAGSHEQEALVLDASGLVEVDSAGVQWLIALANALRQRGRDLHLAAPPSALADVCHRLGAGFLLGAGVGQASPA